MKNLNDPVTMFQETKAVWRVAFSVIASEFLGGCIGLVSGRYSVPIFSFWMGAAFSAIIGLALGLCWHYENPARRTAEHREILLFLGFVSVALLLAACFFARGYIPNTINPPTQPRNASVETLLPNKGKLRLSKESERLWLTT